MCSGDVKMGYEMCIEDVKMGYFRKYLTGDTG